MSRKPNLVAAFATAIVVMGGATSTWADKSLRPWTSQTERHGERNRAEPVPPGGLEHYEPSPRPEGTQIFIGTPEAYDGYRPYYGPYVYGREVRREGGKPFVGYGSANGGDCRRWAWEHQRGTKWLWGIIESSSGEWRCAEW